ncbi:GntR family transcriptional regulator [Bradyrhizobium prioriisuperbiae]|uniref:GntR family transcriptional regulator n=1 Tax=Bradyrhizobium prioriisuperbiae TaxID=2854389 RepID=UPI0028EEA3F7|nr:GntR family transcriptional regulator [Bradyrhizobium prioritasuperba]
METRYAYVARALAEAIADGRHPVGSVLPNEFELAEQFAVSRSTVRAAMRELQASGLVSRKKSAGTRVEAVAPSRSAAGYTQALGSVEAVQQFGVETERHVQAVAEIVTDDELAVRLGCRPGRRWLRISSLRLSPGDISQTPICWTDVYIDAVFADEVKARMDRHRGIFSTLVENISGRRIGEIRQDIKAVGISEQLAGPLKAVTGAHALEIRRQYILSPGDMAEVSLSIHPADRYSYTMRLMRQDAATN